MDRRRYYRVHPAQDRDLRVLIGPGGETQGAGRLLDLSADGAAVRIGAVDGEALAPGGEAQLRFAPALLNRPLAASGRVTYRQTEGDCCRLGFQFTDRQQLDRRLWPVFRKLFNRRRVPRVAPDPELEFLVTADGVSRAVGPVDISPRGLALRVPVEVEWAHKATDLIRLCVSVPGGPDRLDLEGVIRTRRLAAGAQVRYGIELDLQHSPDLWRARAA